MSDELPTKASLWVRYLGSRVVHCAETFPIPTATLPERVARPVRRGDVAEIWYQPGEEPFDRNSHREWPKS